MGNSSTAAEYENNEHLDDELYEEIIGEEQFDGSTQNR